jgi:putative spermidine/putrescine transport system substrate-binding protein
MKTNRRASFPGLLATMVVGAGLVLGAAGAGAAGKFEGQTLTVGTYGGSWKDRICEYICPKIEAEGGKVEFVTGNPRNLLSKLVAARGQDDQPFDVVEITDATWPVVLAADFVEKLDPANVPNVADLDPNLHDEYKAANWMTQEGFVVNLEKLKELGVERPTRFMDLLNPALKGKITIPDISVNTVLTSIAGFAAEKGGDEHNIDPGLELIKDLDVFAFWTSGTQITQMMKSGDVVVAIAHAGWGVRLHDAGVPVGMVHPIVKDKVGLGSRGYAGVVKGTKNKAAAEFYINELISEEMQEILHTKNGIVPTNSKVQVKYSGQPKLDSSGVPFLMLSPDQIANLYYMDMSAFDMKDWTRKWNRTVASQ